MHMKNICLIATLTLAGCSFVQLTDAGAGVAQLASGDVTNCREVGIVSSQTKDKLVIKRGRDSVQGELNILARNEASLMGANAIVPIAEPVEGAQRFRAYSCD
jgi:hypothetical protein